MDPQTFSKGCYGEDSPPSDTELVVIDFFVNVETTALATPEEVQNAITTALAKIVVDAIAKNGCGRRRLGGTRQLEVASMHTDLPRELGSCEISDATESLSCSTYKGEITVVYTAEGANSWEGGVTSSSLTAIKGVIDSGSVAENINGIIGGSDVQVTNISYAGPNIVETTKPIIVGTSSGNFAAEDTGVLTGLGKGMLAMVAILALIAMFILCRCCRDSRRRRRRERASTRGSNKSHNTDEFSDEGTVKFLDEPVEEPLDKCLLPEHDQDSDVESRGLMSHFGPYILGVFGTDPLSNVVEDQASHDVSPTNTMEPRGHFSPATAVSSDMLSTEPMSATRATRKLTDQTTFDDDAITDFSILSISPVPADSSDSQPAAPPKRKSVFKQIGIFRDRNISGLNQIEPGDKDALESPVELQKAIETALSEHHGLGDDVAVSPRKMTNIFKSVRAISLLKKRQVEDSMPAEEELVAPAEPTEKAFETTLSDHRGFPDQTDESPPKSKNLFKARTLSLIKKSRAAEDEGAPESAGLESALSDQNDYTDEMDESPRKNMNVFKARTLSLLKRSPRTEAPEGEDAFKLTNATEEAVEALLPDNHDSTYDTSELAIVSISPMPAAERDESNQTKPSKAKSVLKKLTPSLAKKSPDEEAMKPDNHGGLKDMSQGGEATAGPASDHRESLNESTVASTPPAPSRRIKKKKKQASPERKSLLKAHTLSFCNGKKSREDLDPEDILAIEQMQKVDEIIALRSGQAAPGVEFVKITEEEQGFLSSALRKHKPSSAPGML
jgi:hypothetical protein